MDLLIQELCKRKTSLPCVDEGGGDEQRSKRKAGSEEKKSPLVVETLVFLGWSETLKQQFNIVGGKGLLPVSIFRAV